MRRHFRAVARAMVRARREEWRIDERAQPRELFREDLRAQTGRNRKKSIILLRVARRRRRRRAFVHRAPARVNAR